MSRFLITAYPYATQYGHIEVPDEVDNPWDYIEDHWDEIDFDEPELDYCGTDFEYEEESDG